MLRFSTSVAYRWESECSWCVGEVKILSTFPKCREKQKQEIRKNGNFYAKYVSDQIDFGV